MTSDLLGPAKNAIHARARAALAELDAILAEAEVISPAPKGWRWALYGGPESAVLGHELVHVNEETSDAR
jgi:hypothetical protein